MTVSQLLERDDFRKRYQSGQPITVTEFQYPLMQGYDSVMVQSDVELGGNDQLFNNLVGRDLQKSAGQDPQLVIVLPILEGLDGVEKMSKSLGNYIGITEAPQEMFGKTMRITDELMARWYPLLLQEKLDRSLHPMEAKKQLATRMVARFHTEGLAQESRANFERVFSQNELPAEMPEFVLHENPIGLIKLLTELKAAPSGSEARRLIAQGGVSLNGEKFTDPKHSVNLSAEPLVLRCGKRFFARVKTSSLSSDSTSRNL
jgi:tyrosyl-tRNA synthetase